MVFALLSCLCGGGTAWTDGVICRGRGSGVFRRQGLWTPQGETARSSSFSRDACKGKTKKFSSMLVVYQKPPCLPLGPLGLQRTFRQLNDVPIHKQLSGPPSTQHVECKGLFCLLAFGTEIGRARLVAHVEASVNARIATRRISVANSIRGACGQTSQEFEST